MSNRPEYALICSCTDGRAILAAPFTISISSARLVNDLLDAIANKATRLDVPIPKKMAHITLWKPKQPLPADLEKSPVFQSITNKFDSSPSIIQQLRPEQFLDECWTLEELNKHPRHSIHVLAKFPKPTAKSTTRSQAPVANQQELLRFTSRIFIEVTSSYNGSKAFRRGFLSGEESLPNNYVLPAVANDQSNPTSALSSSVNHVRQLANTIMEGTLKARNWPNLRTSVLSDEGDIDPKKVYMALSNVFKKGEGSTVHDNDYVSYHLYFVSLWPWNDGKATESRVHAFLTHLFQRNASNIFSGLKKSSRLEFKTGQPLDWTIVLLRENQKSKTGNDQENKYETWIPRPDFAMLIDRFPFLVIEICSDEDEESDKWRMLLYAAAVLRTHDTFEKIGKAEEYKPMVVACYIRSGTASVYIVFLDEKQGKDTPYSRKHVKYTQDDYRLTDKGRLYQFTRLLYLLAQHIISEHSKWLAHDLPPWQAIRKRVAECATGLGMKAASKTTKEQGKD